MFIRYLSFATLSFLLLLVTLSPVSASQSTPQVMVELVPANAAQGETVTANVYVRNGANIAGADIGIATDGCLRIVDRAQGAFLPDASRGGFTVYDQVTDFSARLAVAITDRNAIANQDDIFFSANMEVVCDSGAAQVSVPVAELSAYRDPSAAQVELVAYALSAETLTASGSQLNIGSTTAAISTESPAFESAAVAAPAAESAAIAEPNIVAAVDVETASQPVLVGSVDAAESHLPPPTDAAPQSPASNITLVGAFATAAVLTTGSLGFIIFKLGFAARP